MSPSAAPQDRTSNPPSPTDSETAQETYDQILDLLKNFQLVLRGGIEKNPRIEQAKKNGLCFSINQVVTEAHKMLGSFDGTTFKRMNAEEREELLDWLLVKWEEKKRDVGDALDKVGDKLEKQNAELRKEMMMARAMAEKMQARVVIAELEGQEEDGQQRGLETNNKAPESFVLTAQAVLAIMQAVEDAGFGLSDFVPVGK